MLHLLALLAAADPVVPIPSSLEVVAAVFREDGVVVAGVDNGFVATDKDGVSVVVEGSIDCDTKAVTNFMATPAPGSVQINTKLKATRGSNTARVGTTRNVVGTCAEYVASTSFQRELLAFRSRAWGRPTPMPTLRDLLGGHVSAKGEVRELSLEERVLWKVADDESAFVVVVDGRPLLVAGTMSCRGSGGGTANEADLYALVVNVTMFDKSQQTILGTTSKRTSVFGEGCADALLQNDDKVQHQMNEVARHLFDLQR